MLDDGGGGGTSPSRIRIPRVAVAPPSPHLRGDQYLRADGPATYPRQQSALSPSYLVDHLPTRRLSEIDNYYTGSPLDRGPGYAPLRVRTDRGPTRLNTSTDHYLRLSPVVERDEYVPLRAFPVTSAAIGSQMSARPEELVDRAESLRDVDRIALFENSSLSYQRMLVLFSRFPALAMCIVSMWIMWGRGLGLTTKDSRENVAHIVAFTCGVFVLTCNVLFSLSHHNSFKTAKVLANIYHAVAIVALCIATTALVFAAISIRDVSNIAQKIDSCKWSNPIYNGESGTICFTPNQRVVFLAVVIGASAWLIMNSMLAIFYGSIGQSLMKKKRREAYNVFARGHDNAAFRY